MILKFFLVFALQGDQRVAKIHPPTSGGVMCIRASSTIGIIIAGKDAVRISMEKESMCKCLMKVVVDPLNHYHLEIARISHKLTDHVNDMGDIWLSNHHIEQLAYKLPIKSWIRERISVALLVFKTNL